MGFELDHVFVAASPGAPEMRILAEAGFLEGPDHDHPGQGTASRGIFFENAYLELIWLTDPGVARSPAIRRTRLADRIDPGCPGNPLGFGLRSPEHPLPPAPFATWPYRPPYLPVDASFAVSISSEIIGEPFLFVLPWARAPSWKVPPHPNGARRMTRVTLVHPAPVSDELKAFLDLGSVSWEDGSEPAVRMELDRGRGGRELDTRPHLPLAVRW